MTGFEVYLGRTVLTYGSLVSSPELLTTLTVPSNEVWILSGVTTLGATGGQGLGEPLEGEAALWVDTSDLRVHFSSYYGRLSSLGVIRPDQVMQLKHSMSTWHYISSARIFIDKFKDVAF